MISAAGNSGVPWTYVVVPWGTLLLTALIGYASVYPQRKDRRARAEIQTRREERIDATADAVLGRDADPSRGRSRIVGLVEVVADQRKDLRTISHTIGTVNGSGKTVMNLVHEATAGLRRVGAGQVELAEKVEAHIAEDDKRFRALEAGMRP